MATEYDTARYQYDNYRFCYDNGHADWVAKASKCFKFWSGDQWEPADRNRNTAAGRPSLTLNVVESMVRAMKGIHRALRHDVRFSPVSNANIQTARAQDAVWMHIQQQNDLDFLETDIYEKGIIMGRAYYEVRVSYDESIQGQVKIRQLRSQDVILDPSVDSYDTDDWPQVYTRRWVSYNDLLAMFGKQKADAIGFASMPSWLDYEDSFMAQQMGRMPYYNTGSQGDPATVRAHMLLSRQYSLFKAKEVFIDLQTGDFSEIPESWDRNRIARVLETTPGLSTMKRNVKTIRWDVTCENTVLHSEDSPYKRFTIIPFFPSFVDGVTMGGVEQLIDPQMMYNKITSQELHIINTTANSGYKLKTGALKNMTIQELEASGSKPGFVVELDNIENLEKFTPNSTPQGHDRLSFKADQIMRSLAGVSNQARGFAREDVASDAIESNQAAQDINFAGWMTNLHRSKRMLARAVLDCVQGHYTDTRVIMINTGSMYAPQMDEITINQPTPEGQMLNDVTQGRYTTVLVPAPSRVALSEADFTLLMKLRTEVGMAIPDSLLIELSPASNKAQIIQSMQGDSNERQRAAEEAAAKQAEVEQRKTLATAANQEAAAELNRSRAEKFLIEANSDPDASYERVENARIENDRAMHGDKMELEWARLDAEKEQARRDTAVELTKVDAQREAAKENAKAKANQPSLKKKTPKK